MPATNLHRLDVDDFADLAWLVVGLAALASLLRAELTSTNPPRGTYLPDEAIYQVDLGREVTLPRPYGPDLVVRTDADDTDPADD